MPVPEGPAPDVELYLLAVGRAFFRARQKAGLSQRRLEALSFVPRSTISRLENGRMPSVRVSHLARLVRVLGRIAIDTADDDSVMRRLASRTDDLLATRDRMPRTPATADARHSTR